jgi:hypothetical protein
MKKFLAITAAAAVMSIGFVTPVDAKGAVQGEGVVLHLVPAAPGESPPVTGETTVEGATASIHRNAAGVTINIHTVGLDAGHAYTVWVFEVNCESCSGPIQLAGHVVGGSGAGALAVDLASIPTRRDQFKIRSEVTSMWSSLITVCWIQPTCRTRSCRAFLHSPASCRTGSS